MKSFIFAFVTAILTALCVFGHSGGTDGKGGHYDHSKGGYHYHHGTSAHQHPNGKCSNSSSFNFVIYFFGAILAIKFLPTIYFEIEDLYKKRKKTNKKK